MTADEPTSLKLLVLFDVLTVISFALISLVTATTYFSKSVHPRRVWYGQMVQWMIYCISYMLLFGFQRGPQPPKALCLFQASLIYSCPPACAVGSACFIIDFYMSLSPLHRHPILKTPRQEIWLLSLPWITLLVAALQVVLYTVGNQKMGALRRGSGHFFCNISDVEPTIVSVVLVLFALTVWFYYEVRSGIIMHQNRVDFAHLDYKTRRSYMTLYIRSAIFTVGMLIAVGLAIYCLAEPVDSGWPTGTWSVSLPLMPIFVASVFGTQVDIIRVWIFWWKKTPENHLDTTPIEVLIRSSSQQTEYDAHSG